MSEITEQIRDALKARDVTIDAVLEVWGQRLSKMEQALIAPPTMGQLFAESDQFKAFHKGRGDAVEVTKAAPIFESVGPTPFPIPYAQRVETPILLPAFWKTLVSVPSAAGAIQVVTPTPQGAADVQIEGNAKAQSGMAFVAGVVGLSTIAATIDGSRQVLDDVPQLVQVIDVELTAQLDAKIDGQVVAGTGTNGQFAGIQSVGTQVDTSGLSAGDALLAAAGQLRAQGASKVAIGLNPSDLVALLLTKDTTGDYIDVLPMLAALGATVTPTTGVAVGQFVAVATPQGAYVAGQEQRVEISRKHGDNFTKNMVTILGERRLTLLVPRPGMVLWGALPALPAAPLLQVVAKAKSRSK